MTFWCFGSYLPKTKGRKYEMNMTYDDVKHSSVKRNAEIKLSILASGFEGDK